MTTPAKIANEVVAEEANTEMIESTMKIADAAPDAARGEQRETNAIPIEKMKCKLGEPKDQKRNPKKNHRLEVADAVVVDAVDVAEEIKRNSILTRDRAISIRSNALPRSMMTTKTTTKWKKFDADSDLAIAIETAMKTSDQAIPKIAAEDAGDQMNRMIQSETLGAGKTEMQIQPMNLVEREPRSPHGLKRLIFW